MIEQVDKNKTKTIRNSTMKRLAAFLLFLALAVAAPIDSHQQRQGLAQLLHNLNLGQLSNILSSSAVLQQTKTGSIISKQE